MSDPPTDDTTKRDEIAAELRDILDQLKAEVAARIDQALDELGALIGD